MKIVTLYERVIREGEAEACLAKFGRELFDPQLSNDSDVEDNTDTEDNYVDLIDQFTTQHHGKKLRPEFITAMKTLKICMSSYPDVLHPDGAAYRGENISLKELLSQYDDISDDIKNGGKFKFVYKSKTPIQSWTGKKEVAYDFAKPSLTILSKLNKFNELKNKPVKLKIFIRDLINQLDTISVPIIITLNTSSDDFLFKAKHFKRLSQHEYEEELLRVSNQPTAVEGSIVVMYREIIFELLTTIRRFQNKVDKSN